MTTFAKLPVLDDLHPPEQQLTVCVGKEWFRYPSSFFLPNARWRLGFLRSSFKGQLPQPFAESTCTAQANFNDLNREEPSRYTEPTDCDYIVDSDFPHSSPDDPNYSRQTDRWRAVYSSQLLDASRSSKLFRAFYIPFVSPALNTYVNFNLLRNIQRRSQEDDEEQPGEHGASRRGERDADEQPARVFRARQAKVAFAT